jgi:trans-2,3-dihydro-3-hydroxyanthranilate isomerase
MQEITREINFAESTFVTALDIERVKQLLEYLLRQYEMQSWAPIIGTSWVNKLWNTAAKSITLNVPVGAACAGN